MTDVSNLDNLAAAISSGSPKIKAYAVAQAAATQSQEIDIEGLYQSSKNLPPGYFNVLDHGLVDDETTNNTLALQALINSIPSAVQYGAYATFLWPQANKGIYGFGSLVNWGERAIRNIGMGSPASIDIQRIVSVQALANNMTIFRVARDSGGGHAGPSFESFGFYGNGKTNVVGLDLYKMNGGVLRDVMFRNFPSGSGLRMNAAGVDCAYQNYYNLGFHGCGKGIDSPDSNSWSLYGFVSEECTEGMHLRCNQVGIFGGKYNTPQSGNGMGIYLDGYANKIHASLEVLGGSGDGNTLVKVSDAGLDNGQNGCWNELHLSLAGGDSVTSKGIEFTTGANYNQYTVHYPLGFTDPAKSIVDNGKRNRLNGGPFVGPEVDLPTPRPWNLGLQHFDPATGKLRISTGTVWKTVGTVI